MKELISSRTSKQSHSGRRQYRAQTSENSVHSVYARRVHVWYAAGIYPLLLYPDRRIPRADRD